MNDILLQYLYGNKLSEIYYQSIWKFMTNEIVHEITRISKSHSSNYHIPYAVDNVSDRIVADNGDGL